MDAIYIDPPYNTGAKDWKYNNDYVEGDDPYRHSKWLAMMERRLLIGKELLNPSDSVLIVSIDEKEYLRLGLLLEQTFPEGNIQMVSSVINRKGVVRTNELTRTNEFIYFVKFGSARLAAERQDSKGKVRWASLRRFEDSSNSSRRPVILAHQTANPVRLQKRHYILEFVVYAAWCLVLVVTQEGSCQVKDERDFGQVEVLSPSCELRRSGSTSSIKRDVKKKVLPRPEGEKILSRDPAHFPVRVPLDLRERFCF